MLPILPNLLPVFNCDYYTSWGEAFNAFLDNLLAGIPKLEKAFSGFASRLNDFSKKLLEMFTFPGVLEKDWGGTWPTPLITWWIRSNGTNWGRLLGRG